VSVRTARGVYAQGVAKPSSRETGISDAIFFVGLPPATKSPIMAENLRKLISMYGLQDRVRMIGHLDQRNLCALFGAADLLLLCSDREGTANVLLESMACGTPVAASAIWRTPEVITTPAVGVLFRDRTPESVAGAVRQILSNPSERTETRRFAEKFTWSRTAQQASRNTKRRRGSSAVPAEA
jgi:glycosyltransferase involved in cell wall biosynthesis